MLIAIVLVLSPLVGLVIMYKQRQEMQPFLKSGKKAEGVVFERKESGRFSDHQGYEPVIRFVTEDKTWITGTALFTITSSFIKQGQKINVLYDPKDPQRFMVDIPWIPWVMKAIFAGLLLVLGYGIFRFVEALS